jgi:hypothetical protein
MLVRKKNPSESNKGLLGIFKKENCHMLRKKA